jgi:hypothetical protein
MCEVHSIVSPIQKMCLFFTCCPRKEKTFSQQFEPTLYNAIGRLGNKSHHHNM